MTMTKKQIAILSAATVVTFAARRMLELAKLARNDAAISAATKALTAVEAVMADRS